MPMSRERSVFDTTIILRAGLIAAAFSLIALSTLAVLAGHGFWMPLNVTTQAIWGPEVAQFRGVDMAHTILGLAIHIVSCLFWAVIAWGIFRLISSAAVAGFGTALLALVIDYGILPERLSPGWHLALAFPAVVCGFAAMGFGLWTGLSRTPPKSTQRASGHERLVPTPREPPLTGPEALRHPAPNVIDQRQQRIDAGNSVTEDPNRNSPHYGKE
ncbi:hypothetical protein [Paracoccus aestuariivivens]|uniref:DUF4383 domain-containing protein n=1 Tax=Paracoccus aestuariivivens TaxID=1820333 RepID=A0A6L6JCV4_9RHOB|nr:hypothetical protein [Paracoccus aestuariivivens]MTH79932.1 hypothetical protein [Paracoccus aestuariivivens]